MYILYNERPEGSDHHVVQREGPLHGAAQGRRQDDEPEAGQSHEARPLLGVRLSTQAS